MNFEREARVRATIVEALKLGLTQTSMGLSELVEIAERRVHAAADKFGEPEVSARAKEIVEGAVEEVFGLGAYTRLARMIAKSLLSKATTVSEVDVIRDDYFSRLASLAVRFEFAERGLASPSELSRIVNEEFGRALGEAQQGAAYNNPSSSPIAAPSFAGIFATLASQVAALSEPEFHDRNACRCDICSAPDDEVDAYEQNARAFTRAAEKLAAERRRETQGA